jgi:hypothetical protein
LVPRIETVYPGEDVALGEKPSCREKPQRRTKKIPRAKWRLKSQIYGNRHANQYRTSLVSAGEKRLSLQY